MVKVWADGLENRIVLSTWGHVDYHPRLRTYLVDIVGLNVDEVLSDCVVNSENEVLSGCDASTDEVLPGRESGDAALVAALDTMVKRSLKV